MSLITDELIFNTALAICKSRTCSGTSCCQWPSNIGLRHRCPVKAGAYDDAARAALSVAVAEIVEACANVADKECARILGKQTDSKSDFQEAVNANLRMIAVMLPEVASSIRSLAK